MVQIFTDTAANLPVKILDELSIKTVPLTYEVDGAEPDRSVEFNGAAFYGADAFLDFGIKYTVMDPVSIAAVNTLFRLVTALVLLDLLLETEAEAPGGGRAIEDRID